MAFPMGNASKKFDLKYLKRGIIWAFGILFKIRFWV